MAAYLSGERSAAVCARMESLGYHRGLGCQRGLVCNDIKISTLGIIVL